MLVSQTTDLDPTLVRVIWILWSVWQVQVSGLLDCHGYARGLYCELVRGMASPVLFLRDKCFFVANLDVII